MSKIATYFINILKWLDCGLNVLFGGLLTLFVKHYVPALGVYNRTCSQTWGQMRDLHLAGQPIWMYEQGCTACKILTWIQNRLLNIPGDHCSEAEV